MAMKQRGIKAVRICLVWCLIAVSSVHAGDTDEDSNYVKDGFYLGAMFLNNSMSGEFDDSSFLITSTELFDAPDIDDSTGFGVVAGFRRDKISFEIDYQRSVHDTSSSFLFFGTAGKSEAAYNVIDLNLKVDVFARKQLRPYVLIGMGFPWITIEDSATDGFSVYDETFTGIALNTGGGMAYYFHPRWAITAGAVYRWNWFSRVEDVKIDDYLLEEVLCLTVGFAYTF
jgi:opacity protein-like surface antigen